jgi:hypothetical protein
MWSSRLTARVVIAAALLAGCLAGPTESPSSPSSPPTSNPTPTNAPVATSAPSGSAVTCPSDLPTGLMSIHELADRSCYGTTEISIVGWLAEQQVSLDHGEATPDWVMPISGLYATWPTVGEWTLD